MSNFGKGQEAGEGTPFKLFTGVENFKVTHVNPTHEELKTIFGDNAKEPTYVGVSEDKDADDIVIASYPQIRLDLYLDNQAEEGEQSIKTRLTFFVTKKQFVTNDGTKKQVINLYGRTAWLTDEQIAQNLQLYALEGKKGTYTVDGTGMRASYRGEEMVISMMRNVLNLGSPDKAEDKATVASQFSIADWDAMFAGNVTMLKNVILNAPNKIGVLLGVKTVQDNKYQDTYNRNTLRQYSKGTGKFTYLRNDVTGAQANGAYPNTDFGDPSYKLNEYLADAIPTAPVAAGFGAGTAPKFDAETKDAFTPAS